MEFQWPEFLIIHTFPLHASILLLPGKNLFYRIRSLFTYTIPNIYLSTLLYVRPHNYNAGTCFHNALDKTYYFPNFAPRIRCEFHIRNTHLKMLRCASVAFMA